jgi:hypothetical protein
MRRDKERTRIDWLDIVTNLEIKLRRSRVACIVRIANHMFFCDGETVMHRNALSMGLGGDIAVDMFDEHKIAAIYEFVAHMDDRASRRGMYLPSEIKLYWSLKYRANPD